FFHPAIFSKEKRKQKKKKESCRSWLCKAGLSRFLLKKYYPNTRDILRIVRGGDFFCKIHLDLDGPMVLALRGHSLTLLSFFYLCYKILSHTRGIFLREGTNPTQVIQP